MSSMFPISWEPVLTTSAADLSHSLFCGTFMKSWLICSDDYISLGSPLIRIYSFFKVCLVSSHKLPKTLNGHGRIHPRPDHRAGLKNRCKESTYAARQDVRQFILGRTSLGVWMSASSLHQLLPLIPGECARRDPDHRCEFLSRRFDHYNLDRC
jgi:hypothetical protein